jgi:hypothetical protein
MAAGRQEHRFGIGSANYSAAEIGGTYMKKQNFVIVDRLLNLAMAPAMCLVLCGLVLAGSAEAASDGAFKTPSGNIICGLSNVDVECVIKSGLKPAPPKRVCDAGDPVSDRVNLSATGVADPVSCAGDPGPLVDEADAKELAEGSTMVKGEIGCATFKFGLVCANSKGHGFFLSRASARYF